MAYLPKGPSKPAAVTIPDTSNAPSNAPGKRAMDPFWWNILILPFGSQPDPVTGRNQWMYPATLTKRKHEGKDGKPDWYSYEGRSKADPADPDAREDKWELKVKDGKTVLLYQAGKRVMDFSPKPAWSPTYDYRQGPCKAKDGRKWIETSPQVIVCVLSPTHDVHDEGRDKSRDTWVGEITADETCTMPSMPGASISIRRWRSKEEREAANVRFNKGGPSVFD